MFDVEGEGNGVLLGGFSAGKIVEGYMMLESTIVGRFG